MSNARTIQTAAAEACRAVGSRLHVASGWETRGHGQAQPWRAIMLHDTVTPATWQRTQLTRLLVNGYQGLPGPIANVQLERNGDAVLIAAGRAYHAGAGSWPGLTSGNLQTIGVEAANAGRPERWTSAQYDWSLAFCRAAGLPVLGHKEWAPTRKQDPWSVDMDRLRSTLARPVPLPPEPTQEGHMRLVHIDRRGGVAYVPDAATGTLHPLSARWQAEAITGDDDWHNKTVVVPRADVVASGWTIVG